ncbi:MAG: hypothetical protein ABFD00_03480 [Chloroherpetonaceae bacterium]
MELLPWDRGFLSAIDADIRETKVKIKIAKCYLKDCTAIKIDTKKICRNN